MRVRRLAVALAATATIVVSACGPAAVPPPLPAALPLTDPPLTTPPLPALPPLTTLHPAAPARSFPVGVRSLALARGPDRPLRTTVWYPAAVGTVGAIARRNVPPARGRYPLVLFSHGLSGIPQRYAGLVQSWATAGFVVAAPTYPRTNGHAARVLRDDIVNQPADAAYVIDALRRLDAVPGDLLSGHIDAERVAAVGHSAGAFTTSGLLTAGHDPRIVAGILIAGWATADAFAGAPARLLFVHGSRDRVVPLEAARVAYEQTTWPKSFLLLHGRWHGDYLRPGRPGFAVLGSTVTDFLRWTLYGDRAAHDRLPATNLPMAPDEP